MGPYPIFRAMTTNSTPGSGSGNGPGGTPNSSDSSGGARRGGRSQGRNRRRPRAAGSGDAPAGSDSKPARPAAEGSPAANKDRPAEGNREGRSRRPADNRPREGQAREGQARSGEERRGNNRPANRPGTGTPPAGGQPPAAGTGAQTRDGRPREAGPREAGPREAGPREAGPNRNRRGEPRGDSSGASRGRGDGRPREAGPRDGRPSEKGTETTRGRGGKPGTTAARPAPRRVEEEAEPLDLTDWKLTVHGYEVWLCFQRVLPWTGDERELRAYIVDIYADGREIDPLLLPALEELKRIECVGRTMAATTAALKSLLQARITELAVMDARAYLEIAPPAPEIPSHEPEPDPVFDYEALFGDNPDTELEPED
jgi:hypothetical protein